MTRLRHDWAALVRSMQVSRVRLNVFVEGRKVDAFVYGEVAALEMPSNFEYRVIRADELTPNGESGGKSVLLSFYTYLHRRRGLVGGFGTPTYSTLFFLDKDLDDLHGTRKRSVHVHYTDHYDIESHLFWNADIARAAAVAITVDTASIRRTIPDPRAWCTEMNRLWREWVFLCILSSLTKANSICNYRVPSQVNVPSVGAADPLLVRDRLADIEANSGLSAQEFAVVAKKVERLVDRRYKQDRAATIVKGKWYTGYLGDQLGNSHRRAYARTKSFPDVLLASLMSHVDYGAPWTAPFRTSIANALAEI